MRWLLLLVAFAIATPSAEAGEFAPREAKPTVEAAPAASAAKAKPKARVNRKWRPAAKPKKVKKPVVQTKRPMP